jgi:SRSO17 transposase
VRWLELLFEGSATASDKEGVLVIDEHGDRKWGRHTAHVGRQWLANIGKTENGVVNVSSLFAEEGVYYPVDFEPYTPAHHFG